MKITALAPWFGAARMIGQHVGAALKGCNWVCVPFAGGMPELAHIDARTIVVSDLHRHVINLAMVIQDRQLRHKMMGNLRGLPFHPDVLRKAKAFCKDWSYSGVPDIEAAQEYFVACWMSRSHIAGGIHEFTGSVSMRWNSNGGDSAVRYRNAIKSIASWDHIMLRCTFSVADAFDVLARCEDKKGHGIYVDPPWPDDGDKYKHKFTTEDHKRLRESLGRFEKTRIVVRYGDHQLIRELYDGWERRDIIGRTQANNEKCEVLMVNSKFEPQKQMF